MTETLSAETTLAGSADPNNPYCVPPELREHYVVDEAAELRALKATGPGRVDGPNGSSALSGVYAGPLDLARQRWVDDVCERVRNDKALSKRYLTYDRFSTWPRFDLASPQGRRTFVMDYLSEHVSGPVPTEYTPEDVRLWTHHWRLSRAAAALERHQAAAAERRRWAVSHTCVTCGVESEEVERRDVHGATFQACRPCSILLAAAAVERLATQRVGDRTRGELVRDHLRSLADPDHDNELLAALRDAAQ